MFLCERQLRLLGNVTKVSGISLVSLLIWFVKQHYHRELLFATGRKTPLVGVLLGHESNRMAIL